MPFRYVDRAKMTTATTGTGTVTLGAASSGYRTFAAAGINNADTFRYLIEDGTAWEIGTGTYTSVGTTMARSWESSSSGALINLSGSAIVSIIEASADIVTSPVAAFTPAVSDGTALGTSSLMWSDLFLASGAVINFNNGDVTITHSVDLLTLAGGNFSIGTTGVFTAGTIELGHASDTTLSRSSAGVLAVEGVTVPLNSITNTHTAQQIELGHATDTTVTRSSAGIIAVEGVTVPLNSITNTHTAQQIELGHATDTTLSRSAAGVLAVEGNVVPSPASQAQYDMLVRGASSWSRLAVGTNGQVIKVVSGSPAYGAVGDFSTAVATTSGSTKDFTSIPSWVKEIHIYFDQVSLSGTDTILVQIGDSGGLETTGYVSASSNAATGGNSSSTAGFVLRNFAAGDSTSGIMQIINITGNVWVETHSCNQSTAGGIAGGGTKTLSATLDRLTILTSGANTFDAGQVNISWR